MIRHIFSIFLCVTAVVLGISLFFVKHEVKNQGSYLAQLNRDIKRGQEAIHVLNAEWSYLNNPVRLRMLAEKHLGMKVMEPTQIATLETLGDRLRGGFKPAPVMFAGAPSFKLAAPASAYNAVAQVAQLPVPKISESKRFGQNIVAPREAYSGKNKDRYVRVSANGDPPPKPFIAFSPESPSLASPPLNRQRTIVVRSPALARIPSGVGGVP